MSDVSVAVKPVLVPAVNSGAVGVDVSAGSQERTVVLEGKFLGGRVTEPSIFPTASIWSALKDFRNTPFDDLPESNLLRIYCWSLDKRPVATLFFRVNSESDSDLVIVDMETFLEALEAFK